MIVAVGVRRVVWKSRSHGCAERLELELESEATNRPSLALKAMATHASIVKQAQGHHDELYSISGMVLCNGSCMLCPPPHERPARPSKHSAAWTQRHTSTHSLTHSLREQHGSQHVTQRDRNLTIFFSNH